MLKSSPLVSDQEQETSCYHCGDRILTTAYQWEEKQFCCEGCQTVCQLLSSEGLQDYYCIDKQGPGQKMDRISLEEKYSFLKNDQLVSEILQFRSENLSKVSFFIPQIHCSSCIWLLENLYKLHRGVIKSGVNFSTKEIAVSFKESELSLRELVLLLTTVGYEPQINLESKTKKVRESKAIYYKIGIAGFCFGNVMLLSFPEYLGIEGSGFEAYQQFFSYLILTLSLPVVTYCSSDYFASAINGLSKKYINIDVPIALGIVVLFGRSLYEIISGTGTGYLDSLTGLIFFLLIGKWYQNKIYQSLSFDRDYKSYFPIAVTKISGNEESIIQTEQIQIGDELLIRNQELIPTDCILLSPTASIDYSFVTGEEDQVRKNLNDHLYAGGRQMGSSIRVLVQKTVNQSYLTQLWNQDAFQKKESAYTTLIDVVGKYFTVILLAIALISGAVWYWIDNSQIFNVVSSILIVACPCALALTVPFTLGNAVRHLSKLGFYAKGTETIEKIASISTIVFDKTGTITHPKHFNINILGEELSPREKSWVKSLAKNSAHPLSIVIAQLFQDAELIEVEEFAEIIGAGITGKMDGHLVKLGNAQLVGITSLSLERTNVFFKIDDEVKCCFELENQTRPGFKRLMKGLKSKYDLHLLSGDGSKSFTFFERFFNSENIHFKQSPEQKLRYIEHLQSSNEKVLMVGDGLNDAGALKQSDVGIALSDNVYAFSPACDGILSAKHFGDLPKILRFSKSSLALVKWGFVLSFLYNFVGLSLAITNQISPLISAVLMPLSSVTIVLFSTVSSHTLAKKVFR